MWCCRLPGGQLLSWTRRRLRAGLVPIVRNFVPVDLDGESPRCSTAWHAAGTYNWLSALTQAGTLNLLTGISERPVTVAP